MGLFLGVTVPIGQGGDKAAAMDSTAAAAGAGINARSAMDNALFAVNFMTVFPGRRASPTPRPASPRRSRPRSCS